MAMSFTTLLGSKGSSGAIATWAAYNNIDTATILDEAQSVIFQSLRVREMKTQFVFGLSIGQSRINLPDRFLDPIGRIIDNQGNYYSQHLESDIVAGRSYQPVSGGDLPDNPITTGLINTDLFNVRIPNHGLSQGSDVTLLGLSSPIDGIEVNGTFPVEAIVDPNTVTCSSSAGDQAASGGITGGGTIGTWSGNLLTQSSPTVWTIFDEAIQFDCAIDQALQGRLLCYKSPRLLSATSQTNFLTARYPSIIRIACMAQAAAYMKDDAEEQKWLGKLERLIQATNAESDLTYRGAAIGTDTPGTGGYYYGGY
jgi:hypothetical protein